MQMSFQCFVHSASLPHWMVLMMMPFSHAFLQVSGYFTSSL